MSKKTNKLYRDLPDGPGVYLMRDAKNRVIYVGKAGNLKRRVSSYFLRPLEARLEKLVREVKKIDYKKTGSAVEALILEARLIKKYKPTYNIKEKDDRSFLYAEFTREKYPRVLLKRGSEKVLGERFGPFTSAQSARQALKILRRIFPFHQHESDKIGKYKRPCLDAEIGLCPGVCVNGISRTGYAKNIRGLKLFFRGRHRELLVWLNREMKRAAKMEEFELAESIHRKIFALKHIQDSALIAKDDLSSGEFSAGIERRIEGYDISNISGTSAVGSMVVFKNDRPDKSQYRKFKIKTISGADDTGMLEEVLERRFLHSGNPAAKVGASWPLPDLIMVDGGVGQVGAVRKVILRIGKRIPIVGIMKGPERKRNDVVGEIPKWTDLATLIRVRDEAHRFAISYHRKLRSRSMLK